MHRSACALGLVAIAGVGLAIPAEGIVLGTRDDFQDGTNQQWFGGTTITNVGGGQGGAGDFYLTVDSNGNASGSGSKVAVHNADPRWQGNYTAAGVTAISVDMINISTNQPTPSTLRMRLVLFSPTDRWTSTNFVQLSPGSGWQHIVFPIDQASLTRVLGSGTYAATLTNVFQIMFRHDSGTPSSGGEAIDGTIGIDNVTAIPAPGPVVVLGVLGAAGMARRRR